jgi:hypothetical protein
MSPIRGSAVDVPEKAKLRKVDRHFWTITLIVVGVIVLIACAFWIARSFSLDAVG